MQKIPFAALLFCTLVGQAQFKADNVRYTTVFPEELCKTLTANPGYILLDVRSQGEFEDTLSSSEDLNIGHIKGALHIDIRQLPQRWRELLAYKDKPLFIYCSHSQRSRRASRLLADSGFTKLFNVNGGLTDFYNQAIESDPCTAFQIVTSVGYKVISSKELEANVQQGKSYVMVDVRNDSAFKGISAEEKSKAQGRFEEAINVPFDKFMSQHSFVFPEKPILLIDESGDISPKAAKLLLGKGFKDVNILFNGMEGWNDYVLNAGLKSSIRQRKYVNYDLFSPEDFYKITKSNQEYALIDLRTNDEFRNASKNYWQNIGRLKGAINIPATDLPKSKLLPKSKDTPIVIYGFNAQPEIFTAAAWLKSSGYKTVSILSGGIWGIRWAAHNIQGKSDLNNLVENVPPENE